MVHEYINKLLKPFFKIRQSKIALNQTITLKLGVTLVLTVTQVYAFVNLRRVTSTATLTLHVKALHDFIIIHDVSRDSDWPHDVCIKCPTKLHSEQKLAQIDLRYIGG